MYFIGGAPRSGKSTALAALLAQRPMLAASTDSIRDVARGLANKTDNPTLFKAGRGPLDTPKNIHAMLTKPETIAPHHIKESEEVWKSVSTFLDCNINNERDCAVEGVAILPKNIHEYEYEYKAVFLVNLHDQTNAMITHARQNSHDWLNFYDENTIRAFAHFNQTLNHYYFEQAQKYDLPVVTIGKDFNLSIDEVTAILLR